MISVIICLSWVRLDSEININVASGEGKENHAFPDFCGTQHSTARLVLSLNSAMNLIRWSYLFECDAKSPSLPHKRATY